jgi:hypothetical protein
MSEVDYPTVCEQCRRLYSGHLFIETLACLKNANWKLREARKVKGCLCVCVYCKKGQHYMCLFDCRMVPPVQQQFEAL